MGEGVELLTYRGSGVVMDESQGFLALMGDGVLNFSFSLEGLNLSPKERVSPTGKEDGLILTLGE